MFPIKPKIKMQIKSAIVLAFVMGGLVAGCGNYDYKKTKDGLMYKIVQNGKGETIKPGQYLKVYISNSIHDSILNSNYGHIAAYGMYDTTAKNNYSFIDFLGEMKVGDSAVFLQSVDSLQKKGMLQYNDVFKKGATITGTVKILKVLANETEVNADYAAEMENEKKKEIAALEAYLKEKNITNVTKTPGGVFVAIEQQGTGAQADSGMQVSVNYTGYLKNGNKFDSNTDTAFKHVQPFEFVVGTRGVIQGWDEGIKLFKEGGKGKLYVPAMLAYGQQSQGEKMPAFSDLIFDIELLSVKAPDQQTQTGPPPPMH